MKPLVYVASPCRAETRELREEYRRYAVAATRCAMMEGVLPVTPHILYTQFLDDSVPEERWAGLSAGRQLLMRCDEIWAFCNYGVSVGMRGELELAERLGKRVLMRGLPGFGEAY